MATGSGGVEESRQLLKQLSHQSSSESFVGEELDLLTNVYFDDLQITHTERGPSLSLHVTPSTADDKDKQFVYLDLTILLPPKYPQISPVLSLGQSRGLSDAHLRGISEGLALKCAELLGCPMVYELVEYARECLTDNNLPCSRCAICQVQFQEGDDFTKTECYHYLHVGCLIRYIDFFERERRESEREVAMMDTMLRKKPKELECPVCRDPISPGSVCLDAVASIRHRTAVTAADDPHSQDDDNVDFTPSPELKAWQDRMASLLRKQKQKGGVINLNSEDDVIDETWVSNISRKQDDETAEDSGSSTLAEKQIDNDIDSVENEKKMSADYVSGKTVEEKRTDNDRVERKGTGEKQEAGGRRREWSKNGHVNEKRSDGQTRSKRTYYHSDKQRHHGHERKREEGETERGREHRQNGHYGGRGNGRTVWREGGRENNGQSYGQHKHRDHWQTSDGARKGYQQEDRGQRSYRARQSGGRTYSSKSNAYSAKDQYRYHREKKPKEAAIPGAGVRDIGVRLKSRDTDTQNSYRAPTSKTDNGETPTQE